MKDDQVPKLENHGVGSGLYANVWLVSPTVVVKALKKDLSEGLESDGSFEKENAFFKRVRESKDRCPSIIECFVALPEHFFLSYCPKSLHHHLSENRERETDHPSSRVVRVKKYEDPAVVARWIQQVAEALAFIEKLGLTHNDLHASNCLLDKDLNLKLADFGRVETIGQQLTGVGAPRYQPMTVGPLKGTYGLCSAKTEQFAVGTLLYLMVYGFEPYEDTEMDLPEVDRLYGKSEFPPLNRHEVFDLLISSCWYHVYPTMVMMAYDFNARFENISSITPYAPIDHAKETRSCEALIRKGLLGPELALRFQPFWWRYLLNLWKGVGSLFDSSKGFWHWIWPTPMKRSD